MAISTRSVAEEALSVAISDRIEPATALRAKPFLPALSEVEGSKRLRAEETKAMGVRCTDKLTHKVTAPFKGLNDRICASQLYPIGCYRNCEELHLVR